MITFLQTILTQTIAKLTSGRCTGQSHSLEPHWEEIHHREIAQRHEIVAQAYKDWDLLFEKEWRHNWFWCQEEFNYDENNSEYARKNQRRYHRGVFPLNEADTFSPKLRY